VSDLSGKTEGREPPLVLPVILVAVAVVAGIVVVRTVLLALRPSEIERFHTASNLTTAWSRGEDWPPAYPEDPQEPQRSSTLRQGRPRSSRT
jgi:hypothetical protein